MIGREQVEWYRRMTPAERWVLLREQMDAAWESMMALPAEERARRLDALRRGHAESNERIAKRFREMNGASPDPAGS